MRKDKTITLLRQARRFANIFSKDASTKVGALFANPQDYNVLVRGYNGMPRGVAETPDRQERPLKYSFFEHAERNAIYNLARPKLEGSVAVTTSVPTLSDVRALISVGVSEVVCPAPAPEARRGEFELAYALFRETGVCLRTLHDGIFTTELVGQTKPQDTDRHLRKMKQFLTFAQDLRDLSCKDPHGNATLFLAQHNYRQITEGYSGMPRGADDSKSDRYEGKARDAWVEQSVRNAIYNSVRAELQGSVGLVTATTCVECARAIVSVGSSEVIYVEPEPEFRARWAESMDAALELLRELGVKVTAVEPDEVKT